jgi:L-amino acid N-acyltransferase YncA
MVEIRMAEESDFDGVWEIFHQVVKRGDTYAYWEGHRDCDV